MLNLTVVLEGFLYFVLLRFLAVGTVWQLNTLGIVQGLWNALLYYIFIVVTAIFVGRRVARKSTQKKIMSAFVVVLLYTIASLTAFFVRIYVVEFAISSCLNILICVLAAHYESKRLRC